MNRSRLFFPAWLGLLLAGLQPVAVDAAPFCIYIQGLAPQCLYFDTSECKLRAAQLGGVCVVDPNDIKLAHGSSPFCLVNSQRLSMCSYPDRSSCDLASKTSNGICVENEEIKIQPNPYANNPNQRY